MPGGLSENGRLILKVIKENPGKMKKKDIYQLFKPEEQHNVSISLGRLLGPSGRKRLKEVDGYLFPGENADAELDDHDENPENSLDIVPTPSRYLTMPFDFEEPIDLTESAKNRNIDVIFEVTLRVRAAKRVGIASTTNKNSIIWLPPGSNVLKARLGEYAVGPEIELMQGNFLAVVVKKGKGFMVQYFRAPNEEKFALAWADEGE